MEPYKKENITLDKEFKHIYPNGEQEIVTKVTEAITRVSNTMTRPDSNKPDEMKD